MEKEKRILDNPLFYLMIFMGIMAFAGIIRTYGNLQTMNLLVEIYDERAEKECEWLEIKKEAYEELNEGITDNESLLYVEIPHHCKVIKLN